MFCVFVLSLFRFHASPETTGEGKRGIGPARAGPMVWDTNATGRSFGRRRVTLEGTGETVPRGDGEPTRGGEGHEGRGEVGCSDRVPREDGGWGFGRMVSGVGILRRRRAEARGRSA